MMLLKPSPDALAVSQALQKDIARDILWAQGWIGFDRFMSSALYAPLHGYYTGFAQKFGAEGDFVTAPEISPLFGEALAVQVLEVMTQSAPFILEAGAGSGRLAADLLSALQRLGELPQSYFILEVSGVLRARQKALLSQRVPELFDRIVWLDELPPEFKGCVIANEVLDALPVHLAVWKDAGIFERGVSLEGDRFVWKDRPASERLLKEALKRQESCHISPEYFSEIHLVAQDWVLNWGSILQQGAILLIDYGFPEHEYYHPDRSRGTVMCHYQHHAHTDPFWMPGLQDMTTHLDFTAIAEAGFTGGLDILGYTTQSVFLTNCGILDLLAPSASAAPAHYLPRSHGVQKLISPFEMGDLFKVMALGRGIEEPLLGFTIGDRAETL